MEPSPRARHAAPLDRDERARTPSADHLVMPERASRTHAAAAAGTTLVLVVALAAAAPFASRPTTGTEIVLPAFGAASFVLEAITATLLFALHRVQRSPAILILGCGYLFSALLVPAWILTFPGVFAPLGIDAGLQATAAVAAVRRIGFPLFLMGYALAPMDGGAGSSPRATVALAVFAVAVAVAAVLFSMLAGRNGLPGFMQDGRNVRPLWHVVPAAAMALYVAEIGILLARRRNALDIWVCLVLFSLVIELMLISYLGGAVRFSVGWWAGRLYGLGAASIVLMVLLSETTAVYARLARSVAAERRARQNRLTAMEALSASIAHEINQPLASMVTNADAGLRWLGRAEPHLDKVEAALRRIVADGHRASKVVTGIRAMFTKGAQERAPVDLNRLVEQTLEAALAEVRQAGITIRTTLDPKITPVVGNAVQLRQVLSNLLENGVDAIKAAGDRQRFLDVRTRCEEHDEVLVSVADSGTGIMPGDEERIFDPFFSTKPEGMGMGLMFCRSIVEAHGGRLWAEQNVPRGAVFHFSLPGAMVPRRSTEPSP